MWETKLHFDSLSSMINSLSPYMGYLMTNPFVCNNSSDTISLRTLGMKFVLLYIYIHTHTVHSISFKTFCTDIQDCRRHLKIQYTLLYILWDDWPIFKISGSKEQLQQELKYIPLKPDCHSWWISKRTWGHFSRTICNKVLFWTWKKCHRNV